MCKVPPVDLGEINELAGTFPEKPFIVLNAYSGELQKLTAENIYADIAFADGFPALRKAVEFFPACRMLFGSHAPFFCAGSAVSKLSYGKLSANDVENISYKNMERILYGK